MTTVFLFLALALIVCSVYAIQSARASIDDAEDATEAIVRLGLSPGTYLALLSGGAATLSLYYAARGLAWNSTGRDILECFCFSLPILAANQFAGWAKALNLPGWDVPVNIESLGANKTWGAYYGVWGAMMTITLQGFVPAMQSTIVDYGNPYLPALGIAFGLFAVWGDHGESFLKRRRGIPPGSSWWPFDQIDFLIPSGTFALLIFGLPALPRLIGFLILTLLVIHPIGNYFSYRAGLRTRVL